MTRLAALTVLALLLAGCGVFASPAPTIPEIPVTRQGTGSGDSAKFTLAGGDYIVVWSAQPPAGRADCFGGLNLQDGNGYIRSLSDALIQKRTEVATSINNVPAGTYYIGASTECVWDLMIQHR